MKYAGCLPVVLYCMYLHNVHQNYEPYVREQLVNHYSLPFVEFLTETLRRILVAVIHDVVKNGSSETFLLEEEKDVLYCSRDVFMWTCMLVEGIQGERCKF